MARNVNKQHLESMSFHDHLALRFTNWFGSMPTFYLFIIWALLPLFPFFRPYLQVILYISSGFIQLVALPLILVGQNLQNKHTKLLAENDYKVDLRNEKDTKRIIKLLDENRTSN